MTHAGAATAVVDVLASPVLAVTAVQARLTADEVAGLDRLHRPADRDRSATGRALLRAALAERLEVLPLEVELVTRCRMCGAAHGMPEPVLLPGAPRVHGSVSHAGAWCLVAVAGSPVGVDVDTCAGTEFAGFDDMALAPGEQRALARLPSGQRPDARARLWARKEALLKLHGVGLSVPPASIELGLPASTGCVLPDPLRAGGRVAFVEIRLDPEHRACVCVAADELPRLRLRDGRALTGSGPTGSTG
jgi:phosphopantetheinyl transferase